MAMIKAAPQLQLVHCQRIRLQREQLNVIYSNSIFILIILFIFIIIVFYNVIDFYIFQSMHSANVKAILAIQLQHVAQGLYVMSRVQLFMGFV